MTGTLSTLRVLTCFAHPSPAVLVHPFFRKPTFDGYGGEVLDGFLLRAIFACVQFFCSWVILYEASCTFQLPVGRGVRSTLQDIRFLKVEYRELRHATHALRELERGFFALDACALTVEADNVLLVHLLSLPYLLI